MKCIAALFMLFAFSSAQRCTKTPPQWEGFFYENDFTATGNTPYVRFASVAYDATDEMVRIIEFDELNHPGKINSFKQDEIYHFKEKKGYVYNYATEKCDTHELEDDFRPFGVLDGSEFRGTTWLGVEGIASLGLKVDHFYEYGRSSEDQVNHHYSSYWVPIPNSEEICVPVEQHFINLHGPREPGPIVDARFTFLNITTVTEFPSSTFVVPEKWNCH